MKGRRSDVNYHWSMTQNSNILFHLDSAGNFKRKDSVAKARSSERHVGEPFRERTFHSRREATACALESCSLHLFRYSFFERNNKQNALQRLAVHALLTARLARRRQTRAGTPQRALEDSVADQHTIRKQGRVPRSPQSLCATNCDVYISHVTYWMCTCPETAEDEGFLYWQ